MKKRLFALVLLLLLLAGCTAAPEADYMAPVRAYCLALQNNDLSQLQQAMPAAVLSSNGLDAGELDELRAMALRVDELMTELFAKCGIRLVDFKLEFGRAGGELLLCDEISPDSCRLWDAETNRKMDKDRFRRDLGNVLDGYRDVLARLQAAHV